MEYGDVIEIWRAGDLNFALTTNFFVDPEKRPYYSLVIDDVTYKIIENVYLGKGKDWVDVSANFGSLIYKYTKNPEHERMFRMPLEAAKRKERRKRLL